MKKTPWNVAFLKTFGVAVSATLGLVCWVVFRWPASGLAVVTGPMLAASAAMNETGRENRRYALVRNILLIGAVEFCRAMASNQKMLAPVVVFCCSVAIHLLVKSPPDAAAIMAGGIINIGFVPFAEAAQSCIALAATGVIAGWLYSAADRLMPGKNEGPEEAPPPPPPLSPGDVFRRSVVFAAAYFFADALGLPEANWVTLTATLSYLSGATGEKIVRIALLRYALSLPGMAAGLIFLSSLCRIDHRFAYLAYAIGILAFYVNYRTGNYPGYDLLFIVMIISAGDIIAGGLPESGWSYLVHALVCVGIGAALPVAAEWGRGAKKTEAA